MARILLRGLGVILAWAALCGCSFGAGAEKGKPLPSFDRVSKAVQQYFAAQPEYQPGDIISRSQAQAMLDQLAKMGFVVTDRKGLLAKVPADEEFLVTQLRTNSGRKFMRQIAACPNGYDRVERLIRLDRGQQIVQDLIRGAGGAELIKYLTTTPGGMATGKMLGSAPNGEDFNEPTGRIYTAPMLLQQLKKSYPATEKKPAGKPEPRAAEKKRVQGSGFTTPSKPNTQVLNPEPRTPNPGPATSPASPN